MQATHIGVILCAWGKLKWLFRSTPSFSVRRIKEALTNIKHFKVKIATAKHRGCTRHNQDLGKEGRGLVTFTLNQHLTYRTAKFL